MIKQVCACKLSGDQSDIEGFSYITNAAATSNQRFSSYYHYFANLLYFFASSLFMSNFSSFIFLALHFCTILGTRLVAILPFWNITSFCPARRISNVTRKKLRKLLQNDSSVVPSVSGSIWALSRCLYHTVS